MVKRCGKKASLFMPETIVKFVLAVVAVAFMFWVVWQFVSPLLENQELKKAEAQLNAIISLAESVKEGETAKHLVVNPVGWYLVHYDVDFVKKNNYEMPQKCKGQNCLCLCPTKKEGLLKKRKIIEGIEPGIPDYFYYHDKNGMEGMIMCEQEGICKNFMGEMKVESIYEYKQIITKNIKFVNWLSFVSLPREVIIKRNNNLARIGSVGSIGLDTSGSNLELDSEVAAFNEFLKRIIEYKVGTDGKVYSSLSEAPSGVAVPVSSSKETIDFFINAYVTNTCNEVKGFSVDKNVKKLLEKEANNYFSMLHKEEWAGTEIEISKVADEKKIPILQIFIGDSTIVFPSEPIQKQLCDRDFKAFIKFRKLRNKN